MCSPGVGCPQSSVQKLQVKGLSSSCRSVAGCHGPASSRTSTPASSAPHAAPRIWYPFPVLVTLAAVPLAVAPVRLVRGRSDGQGLIAALGATARLQLVVSLLLAGGLWVS